MAVSSKIEVILAKVSTPATQTNKYLPALRCIDAFCNDPLGRNYIASKVKAYAQGE